MKKNNSREKERAEKKRTKQIQNELRIKSEKFEKEKANEQIRPTESTQLYCEF